jgi:hypothetical protein
LVLSAQLYPLLPSLLTNLIYHHNCRHGLETSERLLRAEQNLCHPVEKRPWGRKGINSPMEVRVTGRTKSRKALYRNGWVVGPLVAFVISIVFLVLSRDDSVHNLIIILLLVGIPIGIALGALVGLAVEGPALSRKRRITIGLSIFWGFVLYGVTLVLYLMSRT